MTQQDLEYRKIHAVVPQLDILDGGLDKIVAPPIQYTRFVSMGNVTKVSGSKIAGGLFGALEGALHMATGNFGFGLGKTIASLGKTATGVVDPGYVGVQKIICETIQEWEDNSWKERYFLSDFVPAEGNLGDIICEDGEFDECYCGLGHRFFDNGDYFEGLFADGKISEGIYIFANGARYLGAFDDDLNFTGLGTLLYADGACYYGRFNQSKRDGIGAMWYTDGAYVGRWSNNVRHGDGFLRLDNGTFFDGQFYNDQMVK